MRFQRLRGTSEQRAAVRQRFDVLMEPEAALAVIRRHVRSDALRARCSAVRIPATRFVTRVDIDTADGSQATFRTRKPWDRFVVRVDIDAADGSQASYALKGYADGHGAQVCQFYRALSQDYERRGDPCPAVMPLCYIGDEGLLVIPWVQGMTLAEAIYTGRADIIDHAIAQAPHALARLHAAGIAPQAPTPAEAMARFTAEHWEHRYKRAPEARDLVVPLTDLLCAAAARIDPVAPTLVHGDAGPGNFLLNGKRWLLLDLDTHGYADPAYDAGYLLGRLEYECQGLPLLRARAPALTQALRHACLAAMPELSARNVRFFYALTLIRKGLSRVFRTPVAERSDRWNAVAAHFAACAATALSAVLEEKSWAATVGESDR